MKQTTGFSYDELAFFLADSATYRSFCRYGPFDVTPSRATLAENIKKVRPETLEKIQRRLVRYAVELGVETGERSRLDATVTQSNIHAPTDSSLLFDGVRVLTLARPSCASRPTETCSRSRIPRLATRRKR